MTEGALADRRLTVARVALCWAALVSGYLLLTSPFPSAASSPGDRGFWWTVAVLGVAALAIQAGIGRRLRAARWAAIGFGVLLGAVLLVRLVPAIAYWGLGWADHGGVAVPFVLSGSLLAAFIVAAVCCAVARGPQHGWH